MATNELKNWLSKRKQIKTSLSRFQNYVLKFDESRDIIELKMRFQKIESALTEFELIQHEIECLDEVTDYSNELEEFEIKYFKSISAAKKIINNYDATDASTATNSHLSNISNPIIKLPTMSLPEFDGRYDCWRNFYDTFDALVNKNDALTHIQRFFYLKSALKGEAAHLLNSLEVTESNYSIAWNLLKERYENKKLIINTHVKGIFDLNPVIRNSHKSLRSLIDTFNKHLRSLQNLNVPTNQWDILLIHIISTKLDNDTKHEWERRTVNKQELPTVNELIKFLTERCQIWETINVDNPYKQTPRKSVSLSHVTTNNSKFTPHCHYCKKSHFLYECEEFLSLTVPDRWKEIRRLKLCANCFRSNHFNNQCRGTYCRKCNKNHNTLLHNNDHKPEEMQSETNASTSQLVNNATTPKVSENESKAHVSTITDCKENLITAHCTNAHHYVILSTAQLNILDARGNLIPCRALLDSGSQSNFITNDLFERLGLTASKISIPVAGINNSMTQLTERTNAQIYSVHSNFSRKLSFLVIKDITGNVPNNSFDVSNFKIPNDIKLADPQFNESNKIDVLLGAGIFWDLLCIGQIKLNNNNAIIQKTRLGWIFAGSVIQTKRQVTVLHSSNQAIQDQLERFWEIEECSGDRKLSSEELFCEEHFKNHVVRDSKGRFQVRLPMRDEYFDFKNSLDKAINRFQSLERRFAREPQFKLDYQKFIAEYETLGHMTEVKFNSIKGENVFYLPHHGVIKQSSATTKLRVVFDGSSKSSAGASLNDKLCVGPCIQNDLFSIIIRFRKHNYVLTADITKMYRQINVAEEQRNLQRIIWRNNPAEPWRHFQLNTLTYGTAPASFLSTRCLQQLGLENIQKFPQASNSIINDFYVDDLITGTDTINHAIELKDDLNNILESAGFQLRQWASNHKDIFRNSNHTGNVDKYYISDNENVKTLGLVWDANSDTLKYSSCFSNKEIITKRSILSLIAKIFDPLGLIGPVTIKAKLILQRLWKEQLSWDESVPLSIFTEWKRITDKLEVVERIMLPRQVTIKDYVEMELHGFCDASETAYGCCVYIRSKDKMGNIKCNLLCAKSRVAPLKIMTIPRLELSGALLLSNLMHKVIQQMNVTFLKIYYWCDSTIVLSWLRSEPQNFQIFVANRITQIKDLSLPSQWHYIRSGDNPADLISRGLTADKLLNNNLWWQGPYWLSSQSYLVPELKTIENLPETRNQVTISLTTIDSHKEFNLLYKYSTIDKLQRVLAYVLRFINNISSNKHNKTLGNLTVHELSIAMRKIILIVQAQHFHTELKLLRTSNQGLINSKILELNPFLDSNGLLRVGGRLRKSLLDADHKHPIILPTRNSITDLIINYEHKRNLHSGVEATLSLVRKKFWPLHGRSTVKRIIHKCLTCARFRSHSITPLMGDLPSERVQPSRPFLHTAVDYAGPFLIKDGKTRNRVIVKSYLCVFVCFATKAVHLELVSDLSTSSFLNAFKRFIGRRGICKTMYSDNGTNFVGANNELKRLIKLLSKSEFVNYFNSNSVEWRFIPPRSPHFGGLYEAAVKSAKTILKRVIGNAHLTFEQLTTVFVQIESVMNSRPITPISNDPNDLQALTPGHFLIGDALNCIPQVDETQTPEHRLTHYTRLNEIVQQFWKRWTNEYSHSLQTRKRWRKSVPDIKLGTMVLIKGESTPPLLWPLGRVVELHPGKDNVTRVVTVKTANATVKRSVLKLCVLPIEVTKN